VNRIRIQVKGNHIFKRIQVWGAGFEGYFAAETERNIPDLKPKRFEKTGILTIHQPAGFELKIK